jgi:hypothetical protein
MEREVKPAGAAEIVPIFQDLSVETASGEGRAIAMHWTGNNLMYLVISGTDAAPPRWFYDSDISVAYIGERPGRRTSRDW